MLYDVAFVQKQSGVVGCLSGKVTLGTNACIHQRIYSSTYFLLNSPQRCAADYLDAKYIIEVYIIFHRIAGFSTVPLDEPDLQYCKICAAHLIKYNFAILVK